jgi:putative flippase GtrA
MSTTLRWLKFNAIGMAGAGLQLWALHLLLRANVAYLAATGMAVESAVLHNFAWHQRYTWADRPAEGSATVIERLLRFHFSNGAVSLGGNLLLMRVLAGEFRWPTIAANTVAITACSLVNFVLGDRFVFRGDNCPA